MGGNGILMWNLRHAGRYEPGFHLGSVGDDGEHLRDPEAGWPYSIYAKAREPGVTDAVLCHGIQAESDARALLAACNAMLGGDDGR